MRVFFGEKAKTKWERTGVLGAYKTNFIVLDAS